MNAIVLDVETFANKPTDEMIATYRAEVEQELQRKDAIERRVEKYIKDGGLDLERAKVVAVAFHHVSTKETLSVSSQKPAEIAAFIKEVLDDWFIGDTKLIGFCHKKFDLPLLSILLGREQVQLDRKIKRFDVVDLSEEPFGKTHGAKPLDYYLRIYGLKPKTSDGSKVNEMWLADVKDGTKTVEQYCRDDVEREADLFRSMSSFYAF